MLVLSRKKGQEIVIGEGENESIIHIVEIRGDMVRIGIKADRAIKVNRMEVHEAIARGEKKKEAPKK